MMAITRMLLLGAALACLPATPAASGPAAATTRSVYNLGKCIVRKDRHAAVDLMASLPLTGEADLSERVGAASTCLDNAPASANVVTVRGALAQALFIRDFNEFGAEPHQGTRLASFELPIETGLYRWSDCVVRQDTGAITSLLHTEVGSKQEAQWFERIKRQMSTCLPTTERLAIAPSQLRSVLAQSAYNVAYRYWTDQLSARLEAR